MPRYLPPLLLAGALPLAGCAYAGLAPTVVDLAREAAAEGSYVGTDFRAAAEEACHARAARHGRVEIANVEQPSESIIRVRGIIEGGYQRRSFLCSFRNDGTITTFALSDPA